MKRNENYDYLRVLATLGVIGIHSVGNLPNAYNVYSLGWVIASLMHIIFRICLPVFVLLSGVLLLERKYDNILKFYSNRFWKIVVPYIIYSAIYVYVFYPNGGVREGINILRNGLMNGGIYTHFWYMDMIIFLYIATPFLAVLLQNLKKSEQKILVCVMLGIQEVRVIFNILDVSYNKNVDFFINAWMTYYILGYFIKRIPPKTKNLIYICSILALGFKLFEIAHFASGLQMNIFDLQMSMIILCFAVMCFFEYDFKPFKNEYIARSMKFMSKYSFSIYMFHLCILGRVETFITQQISDINAILLVGVKILLTFLVSLCCVFIIDNTIVKMVELPYVMIKAKVKN